MSVENSLAYLRVVKVLLAETYQTFESALRELEIDLLPKKINDISPLKDTKTSEEGTQSD